MNIGNTLPSREPPYSKLVERRCGRIPSTRTDPLPFSRWRMTDGRQFYWSEVLSDSMRRCSSGLKQKSSWLMIRLRLEAACLQNDNKGERIAFMYRTNVVTFCLDRPVRIHHCMQSCLYMVSMRFVCPWTGVNVSQGEFVALSRPSAANT